MDNFEKSVIGLAKTDQALNKIQMIVGTVAFVGVALLFGAIAYSIHKSGKKANEVAAKKAADDAAKKAADDAAKAAAANTSDSSGNV